MERLATAATAALLTLSEVKAHLRLEVDYTGEDSLLGGLIAVAADQVRQIVDRPLTTETWEASFASLDDEGAVSLTRGPFRAVTKVEILRSGTYATLAGGDYVTRQVAPDRVIVRPPAGGSFAPIDADEAAIRVTYTAGFGDTAAAVPPAVRHAALLYLGDLYQTREASRQANLVDNPAAMRLLSAYRAAVL